MLNTFLLLLVLCFGGYESTLAMQPSPEALCSTRRQYSPSPFIPEVPIQQEIRPLSPKISFEEMARQFELVPDLLSEDNFPHISKFVPMSLPQWLHDGHCVDEITGRLPNWIEPIYPSVQQLFRGGFCPKAFPLYYQNHKNGIRYGILPR